MLETTTRPAASGLTRQAVEELSRRRGEPEWLRQLRLDAFAAYERLPLAEPTTGNWRRASLAGLDLEHQAALPERDATSAEAAPATGEDLAGTQTARDGVEAPATLAPELAERGVRFLGLAEALRDERLAPRVRDTLASVVPFQQDKLAALHYAFLNAGAVLYVPRNVSVDLPLHVLYSYSQAGLAAFAHTLVILEEGADATLLEEHLSMPREGMPLASGAVELVLGANARLRYVQLQRWDASVWSVNWQRAVLGRDAHLRTLNVALGGRMARSTVQVTLEGNGSQADLLGVVAGSGRQHVDFQTLQDHVGSATRSDLVIHNALDDRSSSNFTGLIRINPSARQTESSQEQKNILLSPRAKADSDPKLEILNNDVVRCTHGAAVGPVDPELVFYLQSRGLSRDDAEALIVEGFFHSVLSVLDQPALQTRIWEHIERKLAHKPS